MILPDDMAQGSQLLKLLGFIIVCFVIVHVLFVLTYTAKADIGENVKVLRYMHVDAIQTQPFGFMQKRSIRTETTNDDHKTDAKILTITRKKESLKVDVMLFGYTNGGVDFMSQVLGHISDVFYFKEPLWKSDSRYEYYQNGCNCNIVTNKCRCNQTAQIHLYLEKLKHFYECREDILANFHASELQTKTDEISRRGTDQSNLTFLHTMCIRALSRVASVVRLTGTLLESLLRSNSRLQIVFLYRDPRAIVHSILKSLPSRDVAISEAKRIASGLCKKMDVDSKQIFRLKKLYPYRITLVAFEDIVNDPAHTIHQMFYYLHQSISTEFIKSIIMTLNHHGNPTENDSIANAMKWKTEITSSDKRDIDRSCFSVYSGLGYKVSIKEKEYDCKCG